MMMSYRAWQPELSPALDNTRFHYICSLSIYRRTSKSHVHYLAMSQRLTAALPLSISGKFLPQPLKHAQLIAWKDVNKPFKYYYQFLGSL